jgi:hypothetical protein
VSSRFNIDVKKTPSTQFEGGVVSRKLILRAVNDNRPPLFYSVKKALFYGLPPLFLLFFAAVWYFGGG